MLDEVADPSECKIKQYNGPLHINMELNVEVAEDEENPPATSSYLLTDVSTCREEWNFRLTSDDGWAGFLMREHVVSFAFPNYANYLDVYGWGESELDDATLDRICKEALRKDL